MKLMTSLKILALGLTSVLLFLPEHATAKLFRNSYVQFDLPEQWNCNIEGTEWVCSSQNKNDAKESIIILTAKEVGPQDTFGAYENFLKTPKQVQLLNGKTVASQVKNIRVRKVNDHQWVDALHLGSEIPGYYTRYLATVKEKIAILVTLSAHQKHYTKYSKDFFRAVESLRVVASKDVLQPKALANLKPGQEAVGRDVPIALPPADMEPPPPEEESGEGPDPIMLAGAALLIAAIGFYLFTKKKS
jgi:hypothetical protein